MRHLTSAFFPFAIPLLLAACSAPTSESTETGQEQDLTERKVIEHETLLVAKSAPDASQARANMEAACTAHAAALQQLVGSRFIDTSCGEPEDLTPNGSYVTFAAKAKSRFIVALEKGMAPESKRTTTAIGSASGLWDAYEAYAKACSAELTRAKGIYGERLLAGGCDKPVDATPNASFRTFQGSFHAFVMPSLGKRATIEVILRAEAVSDVTEAASAWTKRCELWSKVVTDLGKEKITGVDCGSPEDTTPRSSYRTMGSKATIEVATGSDLEPASSGGIFVLGAADNSVPLAVASWSAACDEAARFASELLGDRLLATGCSEPSDLTPIASNRHFGSTSPVLALASGAKKLVVESFAIGASDGSPETARLAYGTAARSALRAAAGRTGNTRIEGFGAEASTDLTPNASYRLFGGKTTMHLGFDSEIDPLTNVKRLSFSTSNWAPSAVAAWTTACETEAANAKTNYGGRFLAAACGVPTLTDNKLESDFTVWILP